MKKKSLKILAAFVLTVCNILLFCSNVFAADVYYAARGTAVIDAEKEDAYDNSMTLSFGKSGVASVKSWVLWDEDYIYVFAEVYDKTPVDTPEDIFQPWNSDSIEIFVNRNGSLTSSYEEDDFQYRVDINGNMSGMNKSGWGQEMVKDDLAKSQAAAKKTETGYMIEYAIPLLSAVGEEGSRIGFDMGVNNCDVPNSRVGIYCWGGGGNAGPSGWKTLEMRETVPEEMREQESSEVYFKTGQNVALNRLAYMSAPAAWGNYPVYAVDGDEATYAQANESGCYTFTLDLGYSVAVDKINILFNEVHYPSEFKLEISSDNYVWREFKTVSDVVGGQEINLTFEPADFRYLRITPIKLVGGGELYGYAIHELEVMAAKDQVIVLDQVDDNDAYVQLGTIPAEGVSPIGNDVIVDDVFQITNANMIMFCIIIVLVIVFAAQVVFMLRRFSERRSK